MIKFGVKAGIAGGAVYYLSKEGVWGTTEETEQAYKKLNSFISPYAKQVQSQLNIEIPPLPSSNQIQYLTKQYWNKGVLATFQFLVNLPEKVNRWTKTGVDKALENEEIKKFINSFSTGEQKQIESTKKDTQ